MQAGAARNYPAAISLLEEIVSEYEGPAEALLYLGRALHAVKNYSRALAAFNDYIILKPDSPEAYFFAGRTCLVLGFFPKAVSYFEQSLGRERKNPLTLIFLGAAYMKARRSQAAVDILREGVETFPENRRMYRVYLNALFIRGIRVCRGEDYELGSQMLRFVLENGGDSGGRTGTLLHLELGRAYRELGRFDGALEHYSRALAYSPDDPMIRWYRSSMLMELGRENEALGDLAVIRSLGAELPELPWNSELVDRWMILSFLKAGEWRRAADACKKWLKTREAPPEVHAMYAEALRGLRSYKAAESQLKKALDMDGKSPELWYSLALCAWEGRNLPGLKKALYRAKALGGDSEILSRFSILYESETGEDPEKILALLQKAVHTMGPEPELMYALGKAYLRIGLLDEAAGWFSRTTGIDKNHEASWLGLVAAREALFREKAEGSMDALEKTYREYLTLWPDNLALLRDEALFFVAAGRHEEAAKKLEALLAWDQANTGLRRVLAWSYRKSGRYRDAAVFLKALLKENPRDLTLLMEYSRCIERAGGQGAAHAKEILEKAMHVFPRSSEVPAALGLLAYREKRLEQAFDYLREAASRNKHDPRPYQWMAVIAKKKGDVEGAQRYDREARLRKFGEQKTV